jgi:GTPase KRas
MNSQDEYASMRDSYYRTGEGFLAVYSVIKRKSFEELTKFYEQICRVTEKNELPFVVVGNKCDLESQRQVNNIFFFFFLFLT